MRTAVPVMMLVAAARVARVVAASDDNDIGMGPPVSAAFKKASISPCCPLLAAPNARLDLLRRPDHTVARLKLSRRALRPPLEASKVSFGKRAWPLVT